MNELTPREVAEWMLNEIREKRELYQDDAAWYIKQHFGDKFIYINENGNWAIEKAVLAEFRKLNEKDIVWVRGERYWRFRQASDDPQKRQAE